MCVYDEHLIAGRDIQCRALYSIAGQEHNPVNTTYNMMTTISTVISMKTTIYFYIMFSILR